MNTRNKEFKSNIDVSIVIPTYNRLWCLPKAIDSCRNARCVTEIIVVDDGSTDGTWDWLNQQKDLKILYQQNLGQTYAINAGTNLAEGKYIRFLDSDDFLNTEYIDKQFEAAELNNADLVYSDVNMYIYESGVIVNNSSPTAWIDFMSIQLSNSYGSHFLGMLFKTDLVKKTPRRPDFAFREDRLFILEYGLLNPKIYFVPGCAGYWVKHDNQMQSNYHGIKAQVVNWQHLGIYKKIIKKLDDSNRLKQCYKDASCTVLWPLAHWIASYDLKEAKEVVNWIFELNPNFTIPENGLLGFLYRKIGFTKTEKLLRLRRILLLKNG
ncbi:glycosyltransferase family 2 protein [Pedobacter agri]|uniref:glycosyltransferase family 2 protein n=1 Tax=Pedobacter agri TaxID=454586 RepID=UPI00292DFC17|nr:glycosyltransferase family 2 protein [Pedobacter agri]